MVEARSLFKDKAQQLPGFVDIRVTGIEPNKEIIHLDGKRVAYVNANLAQNQALGDATNEAKAIAKTILPPDIALDLEGDSARAGEILGEFVTVPDWW